MVRRRQNHLIKGANARARAAPATELLMTLITAGVLAYAGWRSLQGHMTVGAFVAFMFALGVASQSLRQGIVMVSNQLKSTLAGAGLEEIDATGKMFDPASHEALSQQETAAVPEGRVVQQIRKGYKFRNRLIRPAGVIVAKIPAA